MVDRRQSIVQSACLFMSPVCDECLRELGLHQYVCIDRVEVSVLAATRVISSVCLRLLGYTENTRQSSQFVELMPPDVLQPTSARFRLRS